MKKLVLAAVCSLGLIAGCADDYVGVKFDRPPVFTKELSIYVSRSGETRDSNMSYGFNNDKRSSVNLRVIANNKGYRLRDAFVYSKEDDFLTIGDCENRSRTNLKLSDIKTIDIQTDARNRCVFGVKAKINLKTGKQVSGVWFDSLDSKLQYLCGIDAENNHVFISPEVVQRVEIE